MIGEDIQHNHLTKNEEEPRASKLFAPVEWTSGLFHFLDLFVKIRWGAVLAATSVILFSQFFLQLDLPYQKLYGIVGFIFSYNIGLYFYLHNRKKRPDWPYLSSKNDKHQARCVAVAQVNLDFLALFGLLALSGGLNNPFILMFFIHVVIAAIILKIRWAIFEAFVASVLVFVLSTIDLFCDDTGLMLIPGMTTKSSFVDWIQWLGEPMVMTATIFLLSAITIVIVSEYARRRKQVVKLSEDLKRRNEQLKQIDGMRRGLLAVASHDLKSPLNSISSYLQTLKGGYLGEISQKQDEILGKALKRLNDLNDFVSEMLSLRAVSRGEMEHNLRMIDLTVIVTQAVDNLSGMAVTKNIAVTIENISSIPQIEADPRRMLQLFENLISNGIKYTPNDGHVRISATIENDNVLFEISDTGIGISPKDLKNIFSEFYRAGNVRTKYEGTGLGLSIVSKIVSAHGGRVFAESSVGDGTTIFVKLPINQSAR